MTDFNTKYPLYYHIGLPKTGTTTIQHIMEQDARINVMQVRNFNTVDWFNKDFNLCKPDKVNILSEENIMLHMSIDGHGYVKSAIMLARIAKVQPKAHIILTIREPKKLLCSRYKYHIPYWEGYSDSFEDWLSTQQGADYCSICSYQTMYEQINTYFPKDQIHFIFFEDLIQNKMDYIGKYYAILGLDINDTVDMEAHQNVSLSEPELLAIKRMNRFKLFKGGGKASQKEAQFFRRLAKRKRDPKKKIDAFKWGNSALFQGWEEEFYSQNQFLAEKQIVDYNKLKQYGYIH